MSQNASKFFSVLVKGENPEALMEQYRIGKKVDKYIKYHYHDAKKLYESNLEMLQKIVGNGKEFNFNQYQLDMLNEKIKALKNMTPFEYYQNLTYGCTYDDNGDAWSDLNPLGKWNRFQNSLHFSVPFINREGKEVSSELNKNINWKLLHNADSALYEAVWELVKEGREPIDEEEKKIKSNMINREAYFERFKSKEEYVAHNAAYWNYAYLDENGWQDLDMFNGSDIEWTKSFFDKFITPLKGDDRLTIFEFTRNGDEE